MYFTSRDRIMREQLQLCCSKQWRNCLCVRVLLSMMLLQCLLTSSNALECSSTHSGSPVVARGNARSDLPADWCRTDGACYVKVSLQEASLGQEISRGCLSKADQALHCNDGSQQSGFKIRCCYEDYCNDFKEEEKKELKRRIEVRDSEASERSKRDVSTTNVTMTATNTDDTLRTAAILTAAVCLIVMTIIIALVVTISVYCCYRHGSYRNHRGRRRHHQQGDEELGQSDSRISFASSDCCEAIIPSGETLSNVLESAHHHSSSPSLLVQRSVARHTVLEKTLSEGQFCDVYEGRWRSDRVLVKIYQSKYEKLWFTETEIYQTSHIPHPNILNFIAAEIIQRNSQTFHHLICEYHERGTLFDHLKATHIDVHGLLVLAESIASGLAHLHLEVANNQGVSMKPAIAHCNLTSRSIYVKLDGTCCIANLSLAVKDDRSLSSQLRGRPLTDPRYMAPEFLERSDLETVDFSSLRKADMYSFALVLWEIARRCWIQGLVEEAVLPYSDVAPSDQTTVEEMRELVCVQEQRPPLADQWSLDESMGVVLRVMKECWHPKSDVRLTSLRVKKTLHKLNDSVRPLLDKNGRISMKYKFDREKFRDS